MCSTDNWCHGLQKCNKSLIPWPVCSHCSVPDGLISRQGIYLQAFIISVVFIHCEPSWWENFLSAIKSLVGNKNSDIFEVVAWVFLIKMKYILENWLFSLQIFTIKATHIYVISNAWFLSAEGSCHVYSKLSDIELDRISWDFRECYQLWEEFGKGVEIYAQLVVLAITSC